jgi:hypothetical protein
VRGPRRRARGRPPARRRADARLIALLLFAAAAAAPLAPELSTAARNTAAPHVSTSPPPQGRARPRRRAPSPARRPAVDYSEFSHASPRHKGRDCNSCHVVESFERPDIGDYPDHPACVECHRPQFFRGARPAICANCHTSVGPRARARFAFPRPGEPSEFSDVFPHSLHVKATSLIQFRRILGERATTTATCQHCHKPDPREWRPAAEIGGPQPATAAGTQRSAAGDLRPATGAGAQLPALPAGTFMTTPTSHATCFQCHWREDVDGREQKPLASQCAGCHASAATATIITATLAANTNSPGTNQTNSNRTNANTTNATDAGSTNANSAGASANSTNAAAASLRRAADPAAATRSSRTAASARPPAARVTASSRVTAAAFAWPPKRVSPRFVHELGSHKRRQNEEGREVPITCLQCHAAARQAESLEEMRAKESRVRLQTCASSDCHTALSGLAQLKLSVFRELRERARDQRFDCALCHAPPESRAAEVPCDHYAAVYASAVKEKKPTQGVERVTPERCKEALKPEGN